ncbi:hypothetical protein NKJ35_08285 [Mesorhizobium sp. M0136]|uniref:hypothetical protein n=1 Tax=Mesorhizobium sp. M0136 TaxID=2956890 RepID=UPI0033378C11
MAIHFDVVRDGKHFSARPDNAGAFAIGSKVSYRNKKAGLERFGLSNDGGYFGSAEAKKQ